MLAAFSFQSKLAITVEKLRTPDDALKDWRLLEQYRDSVFLSPIWISSWLASVSDTNNIYTVRFFDSHNNLAGICFLTISCLTRRKLFAVTQLSLNELETNGRKFIIEHNGILHVPGFEYEVYYSLFDMLTKPEAHADELRINAVSQNTAQHFKRICLELDLNLISDENSNAYFTELVGFDTNSDNYIASLSKNKREQIRRSIKLYSQFGKVDLCYASNEKERINFFHNLGELHQQYWLSRGKPGSFSNQKWIDFHSRIITNHPKNVNLIRVSYGSHLLGYLYNLIDNKVAYSIQSGFNYSDNKNDRPGVVSHYLATNDYITQGIVRYEYLAGEAQYKQSLSNAHHEFAWYLIQNKNIKLSLENTLLKIKRYF